MVEGGQMRLFDTERAREHLFRLIPHWLAHSLIWLSSLIKNNPSKNFFLSIVAGFLVATTARLHLIIGKSVQQADFLINNAAH